MATNKTTSEIVSEEKPDSAFTPDKLSSIRSFADAIAIATEVHGEDTTTATGIRVMRIEDKRLLTGVPLVLLEWHFLWSEENDREYVSVLCVADTKPDPSQWYLNDGSTGIFVELKEYEAKTGKNGNVLCPQGLRVSDYSIDPQTRKPLTRAQVTEYKRQGKEIEPAATFYLDIK